MRSFELIIFFQECTPFLGGFPEDFLSTRHGQELVFIGVDMPMLVRVALCGVMNTTPPSAGC